MHDLMYCIFFVYVICVPRYCQIFFGQAGRVLRNVRYVRLSNKMQPWPEHNDAA